jgi:hypothetical protein
MLRDATAWEEKLTYSQSIAKPCRREQTMTKLEQIETAIAALAEKELQTFRRWFAKFDAARWDKQIDHDSKNGKLGKVAEGQGRASQGQEQTAKPLGL